MYLNFKCMPKTFMVNSQSGDFFKWGLVPCLWSIISLFCWLSHKLKQQAVCCMCGRFLSGLLYIGKLRPWNWMLTPLYRIGKEVTAGIGKANILWLQVNIFFEIHLVERKKSNKYRKSKILKRVKKKILDKCV